MTIVVIVSEYDGPLDEALREITDAQSRYEGFTHTYVAATLDDLPHPMQIEKIRQHFEGDGTSEETARWLTVHVPGYGHYTLRSDMPPVQQIEMAREVFQDSGLSDEDTELGVTIITATLRKLVKDTTLL